MKQMKKKQGVCTRIVVLLLAVVMLAACTPHDGAESTNNDNSTSGTSGAQVPSTVQNRIYTMENNQFGMGATTAIHGHFDGTFLYQSIAERGITSAENKFFMCRSDVKTQEVQRLCAKAGCAHSDASCDAWRDSEVFSGYMLRDGRIVELRRKYEGTENKNENINPVLTSIVTDTDTLLRTELPVQFTPQYKAPYDAVWSETVATDGKILYTMLYEYQVEQPRSAISIAHVGSIVALDLETGVLTKLVTMDYPYAFLGVYDDMAVYIEQTKEFPYG